MKNDVDPGMAWGKVRVGGGVTFKGEGILPEATKVIESGGTDIIYFLNAMKISL